MYNITDTEAFHSCSNSLVLLYEGADGVVPGTRYCSFFARNTGTVNVFPGTVNLIIAIVTKSATPNTGRIKEEFP